MGILRVPPLKTEDVGVLNLPITNLNRPSDCNVCFPCTFSRRHDTQERHECLGDFARCGIPEIRWCMIHRVIGDLIAHLKYRICKGSRSSERESHALVAADVNNN